MTDCNLFIFWVNVSFDLPLAVFLSLVSRDIFSLVNLIADSNLSYSFKASGFGSSPERFDKPRVS